MNRQQTLIRPDSSATRLLARDTGERERNALRERFSGKLAVRDELSRRLISYQGNKDQPGLRWFKYKEGFSSDLVKEALRYADGPVLDPFAGIGTTVLVAGGSGLPATGIEIMPIGTRVAQAISCVANSVNLEVFKRHAANLQKTLMDSKAADPEFRFNHVPITEKAFPQETEDAIAKARAFLTEIEDAKIRLILDLACMSILEEVSFTRKDGQYLRWDERCGRDLRGAMNKGPIPSFAEALANRVSDMLHDFPSIASQFRGIVPKIVEGSSLKELPRLADSSIGLTITSPPYANRYDYTRTYALELSWLGYDREAFGKLRQDLISATVENRPKDQLLNGNYPRPYILAQAKAAIASQEALSEILDALEERRDELSNPQVIRLVANYFSEMALVIAELARVTKPGGEVMMVNDNVQYNGEEVPVDLILSDIAEQCGFVCEEIGVLPRGKGNASQQMGKFGRRELRKCVYRWRMT